MLFLFGSRVQVCSGSSIISVSPGRMPPRKKSTTGASSDTFGCTCETDLFPPLSASGRRRFWISARCSFMSSDRRVYHILWYRQDASFLRTSEPDSYVEYELLYKICDNPRKCWTLRKVRPQRVARSLARTCNHSVTLHNVQL